MMLNRKKKNYKNLHQNDFCKKVKCSSNSSILVLLPGITTEGNGSHLKTLKDQVKMIAKYRSGNLEGIHELKSKEPIWSEEMKSYVLNFHGRVTQVGTLRNKQFEVVRSV